MNFLFLWIHINTNDPAGGIVIKESLWTECQPSESYESYFQKVKCLLARGTEIAVYELDKELKKKKRKPVSLSAFQIIVWGRLALLHNTCLAAITDESLASVSWPWAVRRIGIGWETGFLKPPMVCMTPLWKKRESPDF